ncbi:Pimeloyl-ACP methyl ester carboxylesterase [Saccharopolyspora kobensis]|uniref:Pimeloyl-ACP methyl ester carboxylesterase n=1 Tax=Saccharopolyspora kobensis TaxID=146035 RepID=A0A1H5XKB9_9PSEU|nr:alpha/beta hydrolase [Saccharopolyspora kobensis]SEG12189.1 Pimeloyl-ACP methyl ester carboxylesterase [Saccharopolyspora kobensis]SFE41448.1 Pimeloyl-ACP methyl ester carboxylesterase [Saccharopolyspora kobensis]
MNDVLIDSPGTRIAARDHGGNGPAVVLLHGAGGNLLAWQHFAPLLTAGHRVVSLDLRGHGRSGDGPWRWDDVLDDLDTVVEHFELPRPAVVGHSLGGMIAALWALRHPDCPAAISLDGHRAALTHPENYAGMPGEQLHAQLERLRALFDAQASAAGQPMSAEQAAAVLEQQRAFATQAGIDVEHWIEQIRRGWQVSDDRTLVRPGPELLETLRNSPEFIDALPVFAEVTSPFLLVRATRVAGFPPEFTDLMQALQEGLRRDLARLTTERPGFEVQEVDASHGMVFEIPDEIAEIVLAFLRDHR